ncbi:MAG TPA: hypothetical protein VMU39_23530 [Solirubrobacteraceae bacterium]|nr:hypothetical protein [Solirubrobacteraceae bacterium]
MATSTNTKHGATPPFEAAFEQVKDFNEQFFSTARKAGSLYLDSYEKAVDRAIEFELKVAGMTEQEWLKTLIEAQVDFTRELSSSYTTAARSLLK